MSADARSASVNDALERRLKDAGASSEEAREVSDRLTRQQPKGEATVPDVVTGPDGSLERALDDRDGANPRAATTPHPPSVVTAGPDDGSAPDTH